MEKELKLILQLAVALAVVWVLVRVWRGKMVKDHHRNDPTLIPMPSRVWFPSLVDKAKAEPYSQMPQSSLY